MKRVILVCVIVASVAAAAQRATKRPDVKVLEPTPTTVAYGYYSADAKPVLRIQSGERIRVHTLLTSTPARLEGAGVAKEQIEPALRDIVDTVKDRGPGGHILTGPILVEGAEPGNVLEVAVEAIALAIPYAYNAFSPRGGFLPQDFSESRMKIIPLDGIRDKKVKEIALEVPYTRMDEMAVKQIREIFEDHAGEIPVSVTIVDVPSNLGNSEVRLKLNQNFRVQPGPALNTALLKVHATPRYVF